MNTRESVKKLQPYVPGKPIDYVKKELGLTEVVKLASNENPLGCSKNAKQAIINSAENVELYPDGNCTELREKVAAHYNVSQDSIIFGCGTDEVISMLAQTFIEEGDEMVTAEITFSQYEAAVNAIGGKTVHVPMTDYTFNLNQLLNAVTEKTKMIFIANPNNPTGTYISQEEEIEFLEKVPPNILVVLDEAYSEYVDSEDYPNTLPLLSKYKNLIVLKTFSKIYGLASLRVGYGIMHPDLVKEMNRIRKPFNVNSVAQAAATAAILDTSFVEKSFLSNKQSKEYSYEMVKKLGLSYIPTQANFIMIDTYSDSIKIFQELQKKGYIIRPGKAFGMNTFLRVTLGTQQQMKGFFEALEKVLKDKDN